MAQSDKAAARGQQARSDSGRPIGETDIASDVMGRNSLQGDDQNNVHNQRHAVPDTKLEPDADPVESAELTDKDARAKAELNKGGGVHPGAGRSGDRS